MAWTTTATAKSMRTSPTWASRARWARGCVSRTGQLGCALDGLGTECSAIPGVPSVEQCSGLDEDCDGQIDEDFALGAACDVEYNGCVMGGSQACAADGGTICQPNDPQDTDLDGVPDACDCAPEDSDYAIVTGQGATSCDQDGDGACNAQITVVNPAPLCPAERDCDDANPDVSPSQTELCDGIDNDCDAQIDEGFDVGIACARGDGTCRNEGQIVCASDGQTSECSVAAGVPDTAEMCDGFDNNCDGQIDEGFGAGDACQLDIDGCVSVGVIACGAAGQGATCVPRPGEDADEDGVPDVCDCAPRDAEWGGITRCDQDGDGWCNSLIDDVSPVLCPSDRDCDDADASIYPGAAERCDGVDDSCDGQIDEDFTDLGQACIGGQGACAGEGAVICAPDEVSTDLLGRHRRAERRVV